MTVLNIVEGICIVASAYYFWRWNRKWNYPKDLQSQKLVYYFNNPIYRPTAVQLEEGETSLPF